jgi:HEPN domain-containing protein
MMELQTVAEATLEWLDKARRDLSAVSRLLESPDPLIDMALYHCQQSAEKSVKALLTFFDEPFPKTHEMSILSKLLEPHDTSFESLLSRARALDRYIWQPRYPGLPIPEMETALEAHALAREVYEAIVARVPPEARPTGARP